MNFYSVRELRTMSKNIWEDLAVSGEAVITNNGKPAALMIDITGENFEESVRAVRQARAMAAFSGMRKKAEANGYLNEAEIQKEIDEYRLQQKAKR